MVHGIFVQQRRRRGSGPAANSFAPRNHGRSHLQAIQTRGILRLQAIFAADVDRQRVMRAQLFHVLGQHGKGFVQAERITQILRQREQLLHFLPRGGDGRDSRIGAARERPYRPPRRSSSR